LNAYLIAATALFVLTATPVPARDLFVLPEPDGLLLIGLAAAGLLLSLRRKNKHSTWFVTPEARKFRVG
jgi:hypothetical protein